MSSIVADMRQSHILIILNRALLFFFLFKTCWPVLSSNNSQVTVKVLGLYSN